VFVLSQEFNYNICYFGVSKRFAGVRDVAAPPLLGKTVKKKNKIPEFHEVICCPRCSGQLFRDGEGYWCYDCVRRWEMSKGILK